MKAVTRAVLGAAALACVAWGVLAFSATRPERVSFDPATWKARAGVLEKTNDPGCFRGGMAIDLIETKALLGATAAEAVARLGRPESSDGSWIYWVGQCGRWWEQNVLVVTFDAGAKVKQLVLQ